MSQDSQSIAKKFDSWVRVARDEQWVPEGGWLTWFIMAGRGWGKTRTGAETIRRWVVEGKSKWIGLIGATAADARDVMVNGPSGIVTISPEPKPVYIASLRKVIWENGAQAFLYSAEEPDRLNGPQHDTIWSDELGVWKYARETWDMAQFGLRMGWAKQLVTTTPKVKNLTLIKEILSRSGTRLTKGKTKDNLDNLSAVFREQILSQYQGTRLGRQELDAELLEDVPGALWTRQTIESNRAVKSPQMERIVVALDPEATSGEESAETGIIVAGRGVDKIGYVLADVTVRGTPVQWGSRAISAYATWKADKIIAESNNGGEMVKAVLNSIDPTVPVKLVWASRGKITRAEPISALYEQGKVKHVGTFPELEDQMCSYTGEAGRSPDRLDALVWSMTELMIGKSVSGGWGFNQGDPRDTLNWGVSQG
ncbi:MAG: terminase family protein [Acidobacteriia bacterium]|nr:terminase family protein [Terriglobia bacterium]